MKLNGVAAAERLRNLSKESELCMFNKKRQTLEAKIRHETFNSKECYTNLSWDGCKNA